MNNIKKNKKQNLLSGFTKCLIFILIALWSVSPLYSLSVRPKIGFLNSLPKPLSARAATVQYGLIGEGAILLDSELNPLTSLPVTYFVIIIEETDTHYNVQYSDLSGFVEKSKIAPVDYEPKLKFATGYFLAANDTHPVNVRSSPQKSSDVLFTLPDGESAFYYGAIEGDAIISAAGNLWYYVRLSSGERGYVYSAQGNAAAFETNSGEKVEPPKTDGTEGGGQEGNASFPDWAFILLLAVPAVIITLALFARRPSKESR